MSPNNQKGISQRMLVSRKSPKIAHLGMYACCGRLGVVDGCG